MIVANVLKFTQQVRAYGCLQRRLSRPHICQRRLQYISSELAGGLVPTASASTTFSATFT
jgi:hypothetical protein